MMTRDAKIGLLVALAFILIVGILLSEHVTTTTTPAQAPLAMAGDRVRSGTHAPMVAAPVYAKATIDPNPQPAIAVATRDQLDAPVQMPANGRIELGRPADGQIQVIRVDAPTDNSRPLDPIGEAIAVKPASAPMLGSNNTEKTGTQLVGKTESHVPQTLADAAKQAGEELVAAGSQTTPQTTPAKAPTSIPNGARVKEYVAVAGDSLGKMANHLLGANTPANCQAIVALNPSLQKNSDRVIVGAKYLVPADAWAAALRVNEEPAAAKLAESKPAETKVADAKSTTKSDEKAAPAATATTATVVYIVVAGDSLWKIAQREVGTRGAVQQIKQLNPDAFADGETVKVGMTLKLPAKAKA